MCPLVYGGFNRWEKPLEREDADIAENCSILIRAVRVVRNSVPDLNAKKRARPKVKSDGSTNLKTATTSEDLKTLQGYSNGAGVIRGIGGGHLTKMRYKIPYRRIRNNIIYLQ